MLSKKQLTREAQAYRTEILNAIAEKLPEEAAIVLAAIQGTSKEQFGQNTSGSFFSDLLFKTKLKKDRLYHVLGLLSLSTFIRIEIGPKHRYLYYITENGYDALQFLLNEQKYPNRKTKIYSILEKKAGEPEC